MFQIPHRGSIAHRVAVLLPTACTCRTGLVRTTHTAVLRSYIYHYLLLCRCSRSGGGRCPEIRIALGASVARVPFFVVDLGPMYRCSNPRSPEPEDTLGEQSRRLARLQKRDQVSLLLLV